LYHKDVSVYFMKTYGEWRERAPFIPNLGSSSREWASSRLVKQTPDSVRWVHPINGLNASALVLRREFSHDPSDLQPTPESLYRKHYMAFSTYSAYYYTCTNHEHPERHVQHTFMAEHVFLTYVCYLGTSLCIPTFQATQHWQQP